MKTRPISKQPTANPIPSPGSKPAPRAVLGGVLLVFYTHCLLCPGALAQAYTLDWHTIGPGGTSTGGAYSLSGTIEQPGAGLTINGGMYSLTGGFWGVPEPGQPPFQELVNNGGFEDVNGTFVPNVDNLMVLHEGSMTIPGWTIVKGQVLWGSNNNPFGPSTPEGSMFLDLTGYQDAGATGGVQQDLVTTPGSGYRLSLSVGAYQDHPAFSGPMAVTVVAGTLSNLFTFNPTGNGNQWGILEAEFTATAPTTPLRILGALSAGGAYLGLDRVSVVPVEPLPHLSIAPAGPREVRISWSPNSPGFVLQEAFDLSTADWTNAPSGSANPITVPAAGHTRLYRLFKP
ncbi:MAG: DUF642 domain-containing protein [Verrucomicrobiae bacterium]|nr:DUF642 domain-containing protein [Verrucomicrobiae bacterium]